MSTFAKHLAAVESGEVTKSNIIGIRKAMNEFKSRSYSRHAGSSTAPQWTLEQINAMERALDRHKPIVTGELHETGLTLLRSPRYRKRLASVAEIIAGLDHFRLVRFDPIGNPSYPKWIPVYQAIARDGRRFTFRNVAWQTAFCYNDIEAWQAENPGKNLFDFLSENSDYLATYNFESFDLPLSPILAHLDEGAEIDTLITGILARIDGNSLSAQETCEACGFRISDAPAEGTCDCKREND